jgi:hypothetical protein
MKLLLLIAIALSSIPSFAQNKIVSIDALDLAYTGALVFRHDESKDTDRDTTIFKINLNYAQTLDQYVGLMWRAQFHWNRLHIDYGSADTLESSFGAVAGLLYNFQYDDIKNSIFASANIGLERATYELPGGGDESGLNLLTYFEGGKRWDLGTYSVANISYAPTVSVHLKRYGGDIRDEYFKSSREVRLNFLKFDILF